MVRGVLGAGVRLILVERDGGIRTPPPRPCCLKVYDGHGGRQVADWTGEKVHGFVAKAIDEAERLHG